MAISPSPFLRTGGLPPTKLTLLSLLACMAVGALAALQASAAVAILVGLAGVFAAGLVARSLPRTGHAFTFAVFLVGGYVALNRGFAGFYLPLGGLPLYIGELALAALLLPTVARLRRKGLDWPLVLLLVWMGFSAVLTLTKVGEYGLDAVRDAAIWYYGFYALIGAAAWQSLDVARVRQWFAVIYVLAFLALFHALAAGDGAVPIVRLPFSDTGLVADRMDSGAMHLVGALAFALTIGRVSEGAWARWMSFLAAGAALLAVAVAQHRSAFLALAAMLVALLVFRKGRRVLIVLGLGIGLLGLLWLLDVEVETSRHVVSARALIERQTSTFQTLFVEEGEADEGAGTVQWRLIWWESLWQETMEDPVVLLVGRGFGPDLQDAVAGLAGGTLNWDQGTELGKPVRSPHNIAVTIFARSGLVGLSLWLLYLGATAQHLWRGVAASRQSQDRENELFGIWLSCYLLAILVAALFGVILEGPFGAIPFFFLLGLGVAWSSEQLRHARQNLTPQLVPSIAVRGAYPRPQSARHAPDLV